jgi:hypothetical protein
MYVQIEPLFALAFIVKFDSMRLRHVRFDSGNCGTKVVSILLILIKNSNTGSDVEMLGLGFDSFELAM